VETIHSDKNTNKYKKVNYTKKMYDNVYNAYPIFDWKTSDGLQIINSIGLIINYMMFSSSWFNNRSNESCVLLLAQLKKV
jgi:predicted phosphoadenosine phosphosulfate sulfurtransferase